jgi:FMN phosphatase YigB (HAD superfamily)
MTEKQLRYSTIWFDWGDTVMRDDPANTAPMVEWQTLEVVEGIVDVLAYLRSSGRQLVLATGAAIPDESQIRAALRRGGLDPYFSYIYCFKNTNLPKGEAFYRRIMNDLKVSASDVLMVGDSFEKDVQIPNRLGMFAVWFNPNTEEDRKCGMQFTIRAMRELQTFFETLDG